MQKRVKYLFFILVFFFVLLLCFGPLLIQKGANDAQLSNSLQPPGKEFFFGSDFYGRDILIRSIMATAMVVLISGIFGIVFGMFSGYQGGKWDQLLMGICDIFLAFPQMIVAIGIAGILGGGLKNAMIALGLSNWTLYARLARSAILKEKEKNYVTALRFSGLSHGEIIFFHILGNIKDILLVTMTLNFASILMGLSGLSFLGIGAKATQPEWGAMISEGRLYITNAPWVSFFPALFVVFTVFIFNILGKSC